MTGFVGTDGKAPEHSLEWMAGVPRWEHAAFCRCFVRRALREILVGILLPLVLKVSIVERIQIE